MLQYEGNNPPCLTPLPTTKSGEIDFPIEHTSSIPEKNGVLFYIIYVFNISFIWI